MKLNISSSSSVLVTSVLSRKSYFLVSDAHWLLGDPSVIGTWSHRHEEHHTLALEVGEPSLIRIYPHESRQTCIHTNTHTPRTLIDPMHTHHTESLIASLRYYACVYMCVFASEFKSRGVSQIVSDIISTFGVTFFPLMAETFNFLNFLLTFFRWGNCWLV